MHLFPTATGWTALAPAKLNLFFEVLAKRTDGYHEIETLMCPIDLYDTLYFRETTSGEVELTCERAVESAGRNERPATPFPQGRENLVFRAVELLRERAAVTRGAALRLVKRIPTEAGLGGGSSDAAAALCLANRGWGLGWSTADLLPLAAELGSDVPFFLTGAAAICRGRGERVTPLRRLPSLHFVVVRPPAGLSTATVYGRCRPADVPADACPLATALERGDLAGVGRRLLNRLEPAAESLCHWIGRLRREFMQLDLLGHAMSGSGTSYFGLCRHARHAGRIARRLQAYGLGRVFAVRTCR
jgi:4-diphosphocytidyl-2-C-methyl-D-erythritol kinase